jgi:hypothetical protein
LGEFPFFMSYVGITPLCLSLKGLPHHSEGRARAPCPSPTVSAISQATESAFTAPVSAQYSLSTPVKEILQAFAENVLADTSRF